MPMTGARHLLHRLLRRFLRRQAVLDVMHHGFDDDDRVVDDDADGEHEAEHRQRVHREAEQREEDERAEQRHRDGQQRNERRAEVLQEDEDDDRDEDDRLEEGVDDRLDRRLHRRRRVVDDLVVEVGREELLGVLHGLVDRLGGLQLVRPGQQVDRHRAGRACRSAGRRSCSPASRARRARRPCTRMIAPVSVSRMMMFSNSSGGDEAPGSADRVGELLVLRRGRHARRGPRAPAGSAP